MTRGDRTREKSLREEKVLVVACFYIKKILFLLQIVKKGQTLKKKTKNLRFLPETETGSEV